VEEPWHREVEVAAQAARKAAEMALRYQPGIVAETKSDNSPVTKADRECERLIAQILSEAFPEDGLLAKKARGPNPAAVAAGSSIRSMAPAITFAVIRCGRISSRLSRETKSWREW